MTGRRFTEEEIAIVRTCLADPATHHLTLREMRACRAVIVFHDTGLPIPDEDGRVAAYLLAALSASG